MQVADEEISKVPAWLASIHCSNLCLSCHFSGNSGYLIFSHGREIPEALLQNVFSDYTVWSHESGVLCELVSPHPSWSRPTAALLQQIVAGLTVPPTVQILMAVKVFSIVVMRQTN